MNLLTIDKVTKGYTDKVLFKEISLGIQEGDKIGFIGVNGTGKSTLLKIIAGIEEADEGEQQPEVHRAQGATVEHEQAGYHGDERNRIRNQAKHRGDDHQKQRAERDGATTVDRGDVGSREVPPLRRPPFGSAGRRLREQGAAQADEQHRHGKGQRHGSKEVRQRDVEPLEQVEVLRVSERHDQAAEIRRQALHDEREGQGAIPSGFEQRGGREGQHHDERQVVRGEHRKHERGPHERCHHA